MVEKNEKNIRLSFTDFLRENVVVFDGAMGTEIYRNHVFTNRCYDELNLVDSDLITRIHRSYCDVGVDILTTNTYGACRLLLEKHGLGDKLAAINLAGARLARAIADSAEGRPVYVAGSVGSHPFMALERYSQEEAIKEVRDQIAALIEGGVDCIFFETQLSRQAMELAARAMSAYQGFPFILSCYVRQGKEREEGDGVETLLAPLPTELPQPLAFGLNCGTGPDGMLASVETAMKFLDRPLIVQPNAGTPREFEGRMLYYSSPEYMATYSMRYIGLGAKGVGGCCGTTPEHLAEIVKAVKPLAKGRHAQSLRLVEKKSQEQPEIPLKNRSHLSEQLTKGEWVTTVELTPPRGYDLQTILEKTRQLAAHGITAINLPDGPRASARISSLVVAARIVQETTIEPILHFCSRDRNLIGIQADLLACATCDIRNILFITGDPPKLGDYPDATGVFDTDSIGMVALQQRLNRGLDLAGDSFSPGVTRAVIGVGLDPTALDRKREIERFRRKLDAGAHFAITQPVFDHHLLESFLAEMGGCPIPLIAGVWPLVTYRNAIFMQNEVPGVVIPDKIMKQMEAVSTRSKEEQLAVGVKIARHSVEGIRSFAAGVQVSAPFGNIIASLKVLGLMD